MISNNEAKRVEEQIGSVFNHPKLKEANGIRELSKALGALERGFLYGSVRGDVLSLYFNHPIFVSEFKMQKEQIVAKMRAIYKEKKLREVLFFKEIKAVFIAKNNTQVKEEKKIEKDISSGVFDIKCKDKELQRAFERIQKQIQANNKRVDDE